MRAANTCAGGSGQATSPARFLYACAEAGPSVVQRGRQECATTRCLSAEIRSCGPLFIQLKRYVDASSSICSRCRFWAASASSVTSFQGFAFEQRREELHSGNSHTFQFPETNAPIKSIPSEHRAAKKKITGITKRRSDRTSQLRFAFPAGLCSSICTKVCLRPLSRRNPFH